MVFNSHLVFLISRLKYHEMRCVRLRLDGLNSKCTWEELYGCNFPFIVQVSYMTWLVHNLLFFVCNIVQFWNNDLNTGEHIYLWLLRKIIRIAIFDTTDTIQIWHLILWIIHCHALMSLMLVLFINAFTTYKISHNKLSTITKQNLQQKVTTKTSTQKSLTVSQWRIIL